MPEVLLVEDEIRIANLLRMPLSNAGYELKHGSTIAEARELLDAHEFDAILLDLNLPDGNGVDLCREVRAVSTIPILILTARRDEVDRVLGLELGADDYIVKPFSPREVAARLNAVLRRQRWDARGVQNDSAVLEYAGVTIDEARREVMIDGSNISLTRTEFRLIHTLVRSPGRAFSREKLIELVWDGAFIVDRVVDSVISRVRRKLGPLPDGRPRIKTIHGVGYALTEFPGGK